MSRLLCAFVFLFASQLTFFTPHAEAGLDPTVYFRLFYVTGYGPTPESAQEYGAQLAMNILQQPQRGVLFYHELTFGEPVMWSPNYYTVEVQVKGYYRVAPPRDPSDPEIFWPPVMPPTPSP